MWCMCVYVCVLNASLHHVSIQFSLVHFEIKSSDCAKFIHCDRKNAEVGAFTIIILVHERKQAHI